MGAEGPLPASNCPVQLRRPRKPTLTTVHYTDKAGNPTAKADSSLRKARNISNVTFPYHDPFPRRVHPGPLLQEKLAPNSRRVGGQGRHVKIQEIILP
jgi:hypothetical protein